MDADVYKAPDAEIMTESAEGLEFYVVSPKKFLILQISTMGMYSIYWFFKHWKQYKLKHNEGMWPIARAIFYIFFTHSLFTAFYVRAKERYKDLVWSPEGMATIFVVLTIIENISNRMATKEIGSPITDVLGLIFFPVITWILYKAQLVANLACDMPEGEVNSNITGANIFWIMLGAVIWLLVILGLAIAFGFDPFY